MVRGPLAIHFAKDGDILSSTHITVHTFKPIYPLQLVHRPKDASLVTYIPQNTTFKFSKMKELALFRLSNARVSTVELH